MTETVKISVAALEAILAQASSPTADHDEEALTDAYIEANSALNAAKKGKD